MITPDTLHPTSVEHLHQAAGYPPPPSQTKLQRAEDLTAQAVARHDVEYSLYGLDPRDRPWLAYPYPPPPDPNDGLTAYERMRRSPLWQRIVAETGGDDEHRD